MSFCHSSNSSQRTHDHESSLLLPRLETNYLHKHQATSLPQHYIISIPNHINTTKPSHISATQPNHIIGTPYHKTATTLNHITTTEPCHIITTIVNQFTTKTPNLNNTTSVLGEIVTIGCTLQCQSDITFHEISHRKILNQHLYLSCNSLPA